MVSSKIECKIKSGMNNALSHKKPMENKVIEKPNN